LRTLRLSWLFVLSIAGAACSPGDASVGNSPRGGGGGSGGSHADGGDAAADDGSGGSAGDDAGGSGGSGGSAGDASVTDAADEDVAAETGAGGSGGSGGSAGDSGAGGSGGSAGGGSCTPPVSGTCDTSPQCGCAAGQTCNVTSFGTGATSCVPAGSAGAWQACSQIGDCAAGLQCVFGACRPFCEVPADCNDRPGQQCQQVQAVYGQDGGPADTPGMKICTAQCALEKPDAVCGAGVTCVLDGSSITNCYPTDGTGTGPGGCSQGHGETCAPGYECVGVTDGQMVTSYGCYHWCRLGQAKLDCPTSTWTCQALTNSPIVGSTTYGICCPPGGC
jgi:hypothetical protein